MTDANRLLSVISDEIVPLTREGVAAGNKLFGAAILRKSDLSTVVAATNNETSNPLWHGEMHAIKKFYELDERPAPGECLFLATHEPCSLCLSGITWAGFDNFSYLFSHSDSEQSFAIPHDIKILKEVYAVPDPERAAPDPNRDLYNRTNSFFVSTDLMPLARASAPAELERLAITYDELSAIYQASKDEDGSASGNIALA